MEKATVLIVDDSRTVRLLLGHLVNGVPGADVRFSESGEDALELMAEVPVDVVLLDVNLPGMCGVDVLRKIRDVFGLTPRVLVVTASRDRDEVREMSALGVTGYLPKPLRPDEVVNVVGRVVDQAIRERSVAV